jgi:hypothetical protein
VSCGGTGTDYSLNQLVFPYQYRLSNTVYSDQQDALFVFSLLCLIASTCFEYLLAYHQGVLYMQQLVYFVHIMSAGCQPT